MFFRDKKWQLKQVDVSSVITLVDEIVVEKYDVVDTQVYSCCKLYFGVSAMKIQHYSLQSSVMKMENFLWPDEKWGLGSPAYNYAIVKMHDDVGYIDNWDNEFEHVD